MLRICTKMFASFENKMCINFTFLKKSEKKWRAKRTVMFDIFDHILVSRRVHKWEQHVTLHGGCQFEGMTCNVTCVNHSTIICYTISTETQLLHKIWNFLNCGHTAGRRATACHTRIVHPCTSRSAGVDRATVAFSDR